MPSVDTVNPKSWARFRSSYSTTPSIADISSQLLRMTLNIRSVPILPGPMIAALSFFFITFTLSVRQADTNAAYDIIALSS